MIIDFEAIIGLLKPLLETVLGVLKSILAVFG